jgi:beta-glucosidase
MKSPTKQPCTPFQPLFHALLALALTTASSLAAAQILSSASAPPPTIFSLETTQRATTLLQQLTLEEKVGQLSQLFLFEPSKKIEDDVSQGRIGSLLFVTDPVQINRLQHLAVDSSPHHIPLIFGFDVIHGFRTIFPVPLAMAASWDPALVEHSQSIAAAEARSVGIDWAFAPMVDIARDPRWGRIVEGAGEDPYLGSAIAAAQVRGFQGPAIGTPDHVLACVKHFAGYGAAEGGRDYDASYISDAQLHNVYLAPFHAAVQAGVGSVMSAYMDLNDVPATGNRFLLDETLRKQWHFQGFVVSDADAVKSLQKHGFASDPEDAAVRALTAGVNMEMALGTDAYTHLPEALKQGRITQQQIDTAVLPILEAKIQLGLFEHPYVDEPHSKQVLDDPAHRTASRLAAERSAVLLRNQNNLLPLSKSSYKNIAVLGPLGDSQLDTIGSWAFQQKLEETVTVVAGLKAKLGSSTQISYTPATQIRRFYPSFFDQIFRLKPEPEWSPTQATQEFSKAINLAKQSDLIILTLGEAQNMSGEAASRSSLDLPGDQQHLFEAATALGKPIVLVLFNGRPLNLTWASEHVPAILEAWYPGTQGGSAVANLLFGDAVPGGKLPISWPRNVGQVPINYSHNLTQDSSKQGQRYWNEPSTPLFPFGYGLSYSTFAFSNFVVAQPTIKLDQSLDIAVDVENTGSVTADEVAQLYIHQQSGSASRPVRELKGFQRITLEPHQKFTIHFALTPQDRSYWSAADRHF